MDEKLTSLAMVSIESAHVRDLNLYRMLNVFVSVVKLLKTEPEYFVKFSEKCFLCFMVSHYSTALVSANNVLNCFV